MENNNNKQESIFGMQVDQDATYNILEFAKWARFLGIVGFVMIGLIFLGAIFMLISFSTISGIGSGLWLFLLYILIGVLYLYPTMQLYKASNAFKTAMLSNDQLEFNNGTLYLKNCFKFMGILMIIVLALYAIMIIFALIGGISNLI